MMLGFTRAPRYMILKFMQTSKAPTVIALFHMLNASCKLGHTTIHPNEFKAIPSRVENFMVQWWASIEFNLLSTFDVEGTSTHYQQRYVQSTDCMWTRTPSRYKKKNLFVLDLRRFNEYKLEVVNLRQLVNSLLSFLEWVTMMDEEV